MINQANSANGSDGGNKSALNPSKVIARNTLYGMGAQFALRGLSLFFNIFIVRQLGDTGFGQYSIILAWTGIFSFIGDMGITQYMSREIARDREKALSLFWDVAVLRFILAIITIIITVLGAMYVGYAQDVIIADRDIKLDLFHPGLSDPIARDHWGLREAGYLINICCAWAGDLFCVSDRILAGQSQLLVAGSGILGEFADTDLYQC